MSDLSPVRASEDVYDERNTFLLKVPGQGDVDDDSGSLHPEDRLCSGSLHSVCLVLRETSV